MIQGIKNKIEAKFEELAYFIYDHHKKIIPAVVLTVILLGLNLFTLTIDVSTEGFLYEDDPKRVAYTELRDQFGRDERVIVAIKTKDIFDLTFINQLHSLHSELEEKVPYLKDINSIINARKTIGENDSMVVSDLFEEFPIEQEAVAQAKAYIAGSTFFEDLLISESQQFTTLVLTSQTYSSLGESSEATDDFSDLSTLSQGELPASAPQFITDQENSEMLEAIETIVDEYRAQGLEIHTVGMPAFIHTLKYEMISSMLLFVFLLLLVIVLLLAKFFKRKVGVILPMMTVGLSIISTLSLMAIFSIPLSMMSAILPSFILSIGIGGSVHLLSIFFKEFDQNGGDKRSAIAYALGHSGLAIALTTFTTAVSLLSFGLSDIPPVAYLGIFAATGAMIALLLTIVFIPSMLSLFTLKPNGAHLESHNQLDDFLKKIALFSISKAKGIIAVSTLIILGSLYLSSSLKYMHDPLAWVPDDNVFRVSTGVIDKELKGSMSLEIVVDSGVENGIYEPKLLKAIDSMTAEISQIQSDVPFVGKIISITDMLKEINKALNENKASASVIPQDKQLIAQEFLLFENSGSDDLETIVDSQFSKTKVTIKMPWVDAVAYHSFLAQVQNIVHKHMEPYAKTSVTGMIPMVVETVNASIISTINSYIIAYGLIALLMILLLGDFKLGLVSMIPNIAPVIFGLSIMYLFQMNLDMFTILIGAIAIGLAVDDTIHFMHNFKRYHSECGNVDEAITQTITSTGRAMFMTTVILSSGFFIYMFSEMSNIFNFGAITGIVIIIALLADFFLTPALLKLLVKDVIAPPQKH